MTLPLRAAARCVAGTVLGLVAVGCDRPIHYRSDEGRYLFHTDGRLPPTVYGELGPRPTYLAGSHVGAVVGAYCPLGWEGECVSPLDLTECVEVEIPRELWPEGEEPPATELVVPEGIVTVPVRAKDGCDYGGPPLYDDVLTFRGVAVDEVSVTFLPVWQDAWRSIADGTDDPRDVWTAGAALAAVPPPEAPDEPVPVAPGIFELSVLLRDREGVPVAVPNEQGRFEVLAGSPMVDVNRDGEDDGTLSFRSWYLPQVAMSEGDRIAVHLETGAQDLGAFEVEVVDPDDVVELQVGAAFLSRPSEDGAYEGSLVAVAAAWDAQGRLLRGGDVTFTVEGDGLEPQQIRGAAGYLRLPVPASGRSERCATVAASLGSQRDATQLCWAPEPAPFCVCRSGGGRPPPGAVALALLALAGRRRLRHGGVDPSGGGERRTG